MATRTTKAKRSASAKKAAATRKRNAAKRSAAAKKAAATRKRNAKKAPRKGTKASRSAAAKKAAATRKRNAAAKSRKSRTGTKASRSSAAKKAAATRKRNAAKRSTAAKKAAATRKRNARKGSRKSAPKRGSTSAKRSRAAKKAAATRKRNASKRSRAAKKAAATRKRNGRKSPARRRSKNARKTVSKNAKSLYGAFMKPINSFLPNTLPAAVSILAIGGLYAAIRPYVWERINLTGGNGYIAQAAQMLPIGNDAQTDLANTGNKLLHLGSIHAVGYLLSSKKALGLVDAKTTNMVSGFAALYYGMELAGEVQSFGIGNMLRNLPVIGDGINMFMTSGGGPTYGTLGMAHGNMTGAHMTGAHNYSMGMSTMNNKMFGAHNMTGAPAPALLPMNNGIVNTAATRGTAGNAIFGTKSLGSSRVNLF